MYFIKVGLAIIVGIVIGFIVVSYFQSGRLPF